MIFALYHAVHENAGLITEVAKEIGVSLTEVHLYEGEGFPRDISDLKCLVVMGGPMNVDQVEKFPFLLPELDLMERVLKEDKPVLGICLGAQLIAKALGSRVYPNPTKEVGWHPIQLTTESGADPLFKNFPKTQTVLHWHGDTFDLPKEAVLLAFSHKCKNQAFRWGKKAYGLQFHLEATPKMVEHWCGSDATYIKSAGEKPEHILIRTLQAYQELEPIAKRFFSNFLKTILSPPLTIG